MEFDDWLEGLLCEVRVPEGTCFERHGLAPLTERVTWLAFYGVWVCKEFFLVRGVLGFEGKEGEGNCI